MLKFKNRGVIQLPSDLSHNDFIAESIDTNHISYYNIGEDTHNQNTVRGAVAMGIMIISMVSFFTLQKFLYPTFTYQLFTFVYQ